MNKVEYKKRISNMTDLVHRANPTCFVVSINLDLTEQEHAKTKRLFRGWDAHNGVIKKYIPYPGDDINLKEFDILLKMEAL